MRFAWVQPPPDPDALFEAAEQAASAGDLALAERLYYACLSASPRDPVIRFNLGNVVRDLGRAAEAKAHYLAALDCRARSSARRISISAISLMSAGQTDGGGNPSRARRASPTPTTRTRSTISPPSISGNERFRRRGAAARALSAPRPCIRPGSHEARKLLLACRAVLAPTRVSASNRVTSQTVP